MKYIFLFLILTLSHTNFCSMWDLSLLNRKDEKSNSLVQNLNNNLKILYNLEQKLTESDNPSLTYVDSLKNIQTNIHELCLMKTIINNSHNFYKINIQATIKDHTKINVLKSNYLDELKEKCEIFLKSSPSVNDLKASSDSENSDDYHSCLSSESSSGSEKVSDTEEWSSKLNKCQKKDLVVHDKLLNPAQTDTPPKTPTKINELTKNLSTCSSDIQLNKGHPTQTPSYRKNGKNEKSWFAKFRVPIIAFLAVSIAATCWYFKNSWFGKNPA